MSDPALRAAMLAAAREFNAGRYFEAHEALEDALDDVPESAWTLVLGLIQVAVGYHKITQSLFPGAARMLEIGIEKLEPYDASEAGIDLASLRDRARADLVALRSGTLEAGALAQRPPRLVPLPSCASATKAEGER